MKIHEGLVNAKYMNEQNPDTFEIPSETELNNLKVGNYVRICVDRERFWCEIIEFKDRNLLCRVDNHLIFSWQHGLCFNDLILIKKENVYSILNEPIN